MEGPAMKTAAFLFAVISGALALPTEPTIDFGTTLKPLDADHVPSSACENMVPVHGDADPRPDTAPYTVSTNTSSVAPGETVRVTITGKNNEQFKGIYLQARKPGNTEALGSFLPQPDLREVFVSDCLPGKQNAVSFVTRNNARTTLSFDWVAPSFVKGESEAPVIFRSTVVKSFSDFWVGVESEIVKIQAKSQH